MTEDGEIDIEAYKALVSWHVREGTDGLCVLGTTGEAATMTMAEREVVLTDALARRFPQRRGARLAN